MAIMPELITKTSVIGRSPKGQAVMCFENEAMARLWVEKTNEDGKEFRIKWFKQTITEEEIEISINPQS